MVTDSGTVNTHIKLLLQVNEKFFDLTKVVYRDGVKITGEDRDDFVYVTQ